MLDRRTLLGAAAAPLLWNAAFRQALADTPKDVVIMAWQIDDMICLRPPGELRVQPATKSPATSTKNSSSPTPRTPPRSTPNSPTHWETSEDGLTTTFHLAPGRTFASGNPVTADDVVFSLSRAVLLDKAPAFIINQFGFTKDNVAQRITAPDPATVAVKLPAPIRPASCCIACPPTWAASWTRRR